MTLKPYSVKQSLFFLICLLILMSGLFQPLLYSQVTNIWALGDGEKIFRNDPDHPSKNGNYIWDKDKIQIKGFYNEVLAFQVIVEAKINGAKAIEISVEAPVHKESGKAIGANSLKYGPYGTIEVYSQHYLRVSNPTSPLWFYGSKNAQPEKMTGWIPDALIPTDAFPGMGGLPLNIPPVNRNDDFFSELNTQNQGFWIDIHLPRDQENFPPGIYTGKVRIHEEGNLIKEISLEATLLPQYLSEENRTKIWVFAEGFKSYFPGAPHDIIEKLMKFEGHRHRIDITGGSAANYNPFDLEVMNEYKIYINGSAFFPSNGYQGPGQGIGEKFFPIGMYGANVMGNTEKEVWQQSDLWVNWFKKNAKDAIYFWYIIDEPGPEYFSWINERAYWLKNNPGPGKHLPVFTTSSYQHDLSKSITYWAANNGTELNRLDSIRKSGGDYWFYNGNRPRYGSVILEGSAVDFRVNSWILYKYNISVWFIWHGTHWQHNSQGPKGRLHQNVFTNPLTFISDGMHFGNGDGILFYPGRMPFYPEQDRGLNQILPSIRLKNIRRGQQDSIIMWMAEQKAGREKVLEIISKIVPKAMTEIEMNDKVYWSQHGDDYDRIRDELIELL